jgi:hypothetical protein
METLAVNGRKREQAQGYELRTEEAIGPRSITEEFNSAPFLHGCIVC